MIEAFGCASKALGAPASAWRSLGLPAACAEARRSVQVRDGASVALAWLERPAQHLLMWDQPDYPALLAELDDAPPLLFVAGSPAILENRSWPWSAAAALPGPEWIRRRPFPAAWQAPVLSLPAAWPWVSTGGPPGSIRCRGQTIGVLGTGLENFYPQRHRRLAEAMIAQGSAVVSEFPLDAGPQAGNFPRRNRIISGLSLGVLVVEASVASGSLITARLAAEQGREVYAIPGSIHHPGARGCHQLIRDGAVLVETIEHILEGLRGWQALSRPAPVAVTHPLVALLHAAPQTSEGLAIASGQSLCQVLASLTELELRVG